MEKKDELLPFLKISIDSTTLMLKVKHDLSLSPSSENWDSYLVGLNLPEHNPEKVNKPFVPKFPTFLGEVSNFSEAGLWNTDSIFSN